MSKPIPFEELTVAEVSEVTQDRAVKALSSPTRRPIP